MRCAIFLCLCVLIFVSLGEARSFNRDSMKNRFLSQFASRRFGFDKKGEVTEESTKEDDGKDFDMIPTATLDVISHAIQCMLEKDMWENVPEDVWTTSDDTCAWTGYMDSEYFGCIHTIHSVNSYIKNPEKRKELDNAFRMFSEAIECSGMEELGKALEDSPLEFVHTASEIMGSHCEKRIGEMYQYFEKEENAKCLQRSEGTAIERELMKKLTNLLASDQSQKRAHKRSAEWDHEISHAGFEAIVFAGYCVQYGDQSKLCRDTKHGVEVYVNAIKDGDQETVDGMERMFVTFNEVFKCGWFDKLRNGILESLTQCDTTAHGVISRVAVDINEMLNEQCERRMYELANLHEESGDDNQESGQDNQKPGKIPEQKPEQDNQTKRKLLIQAISDLLKQK